MAHRSHWSVYERKDEFRVQDWNCKHCDPLQPHHHDGTSGICTETTTGESRPDAKARQRAVSTPTMLTMMMMLRSRRNRRQGTVASSMASLCGDTSGWDWFDALNYCQGSQVVQGQVCRVQALRHYSSRWHLDVYRHEERGSIGVLCQSSRSSVKRAKHEL